MAAQRPADPRPEYPRPQFRRADWLCLNGPWEFAFDDRDVGLTEGWPERPGLDGRIVVPFAYQARASGVGDRAVHPVLWYRRTFVVPAAWGSRRLRLHFGAVDYVAEIRLNGRRLGRHEGGTRRSRST